MHYLLGQLHSVLRAETASQDVVNKLVGVISYRVQQHRVNTHS
jgi:hypothetical protein